MPELIPLFSLKGKTALVCGASQGLGEATARGFAELGAQVILVARSADKLADILKSLPGDGHEAIACDLASNADLARLLQRLNGKQIEILVNNSGGPKGGPILDADPGEFIAGFHQHIIAAQRLTQALVPGMKEAKYGRILNIISTSVKAPLPGLGVSNTIRGAMASWAKTMAGELAPFGITVNNVLPGYTETARLESLRKSASERLAKTESDIAEDWKKTIPAGRFGEAWEFGAAVTFLATPLASYITGINLPVDGGRTQSL